MLADENLLSEVSRSLLIWRGTRVNVADAVEPSRLTKALNSASINNFAQSFKNHSGEGANKVTAPPADQSIEITPQNFAVCLAQTPSMKAAITQHFQPAHHIVSTVERPTPKMIQNKDLNICRNMNYYGGSGSSDFVTNYSNDPSTKVVDHEVSYGSISVQRVPAAVKANAVNSSSFSIAPYVDELKASVYAKAYGGNSRDVTEYCNMMFHDNDSNNDGYNKRKYSNNHNYKEVHGFPPKNKIINIVTDAANTYTDEGRSVSVKRKISNCISEKPKANQHQRNNTDGASCVTALPDSSNEQQDERYKLAHLLLAVKGDIYNFKASSNVNHDAYHDEDDDDDDSYPARPGLASTVSVIDSSSTRSGNSSSSSSSSSSGRNISSSKSTSSSSSCSDRNNSSGKSTSSSSSSDRNSSSGSNKSTDVKKKDSLHRTHCNNTTWSMEEDEKLKELTLKYGSHFWELISQSIEGRTGKQCRERWHNQLDTRIVKTDWTLDEDSMIESMHKKLGNQWAKITKFLPGRTDNAVKNRFHLLCRRAARQKKKEEGKRIYTERMEEATIRLQSLITAAALTADDTEDGYH